MLWLMSKAGDTTSSLPRWTDAQSALTRHAQRFLRSEVREAIERETRELLGTPLLVSSSLPTVVDQESRNAWAQRHCLVFVMSNTHGRVVVELDRFLAACIVDRLLGGSGGTTARFTNDQARELDKGILAYFAARLLARVGTGQLVLEDVVVSHEDLRDVLGKEECAVWTLPALLGEDQGPIRVIATRTLLAHAQPRSTPRDFSDLPIECVASAGRATLWMSELSSLEVGDAIVLDDAKHDHVWIDAHSSALSFRCKLERGALHVVQKEMGNTMSTTQSKRHTGEEEPQTAVDVSLRHVQDLPVEIHAELARFTVPYVDLTTLVEGDVLRTGRAITDQVTLRVGSRTIANAELVDIDGELGVRILSLVERAQ